MKRKKTRNPDKIALRQEKRIKRRNMRLLKRKRNIRKENIKTIIFVILFYIIYLIVVLSLTI